MEEGDQVELKCDPGGSCLKRGCQWTLPGNIHIDLVPRSFKMFEWTGGETCYLEENSWAANASFVCNDPDIRWNLYNRW